MDKELFVAIHEAGHAVMSVRLNNVLGDVSIVRDGQSGLMGFSSDESGDPANEVDAQDFVLILCAGYAALVASGLDDATARRGAWGDFEAAESVLDRYKMGALQDWLSRSVETLKSPENLAAINRVADELLRRKTIDGDFAAMLVGCSDDGIGVDHPEFLNYLLFHGIE